MQSPRDVEVVTGDAWLTSQYADLVAADLVLACGLFGNMTNAHIERTIGSPVPLEPGAVMFTITDHDRTGPARA